MKRRSIRCQDFAASTVSKSAGAASLGSLDKEDRI